MVYLLLVVIYLAFISLGLPDALLGSAWPLMHQEFQVPVSYAGLVFGIISVGPIFSSLFSDRLTKKLGTGKVTAVSVAMTAIALIGFSLSDAYWQLLLWAIPYGLGAGSIDACLNNYVAIHYESRHMSWLHCMWGIGAATGPYIMSYVLNGGQAWNLGYRYVGGLQVLLTVILIATLPLWKKEKTAGETKTENEENSTGIVKTLSLPGVKAVALVFFCYCALEQTVGLWASSYLVLLKGMAEELAAQFGALFYMGITAGRFLCGFITYKLEDRQMIRCGMGIILAGIVTMVLPLGDFAALAGFVMIGLGCAPIYPCTIHSTPALFGEERSQSVVGIEMAGAYVGILCMPPLFGLIANHIHVGLLPLYLAANLVVMEMAFEKLQKMQ